MATIVMPPMVSSFSSPSKSNTVNIHRSSTTATNTTSTVPQVVKERNDNSNPQQGTSVLELSDAAVSDEGPTGPALSANNSNNIESATIADGGCPSDTTTPEGRSSLPHAHLSKGPAPTKKDERKLFVGGLPAHVTSTEFREFFTQFGPVLDSIVLVDKNTNRSRGFGFVTFENVDTARQLLAMGHPEGMCPPNPTTGRLPMLGKTIEVKCAEPRESSRRGGYHTYNHHYHQPNHHTTISHRASGAGAFRANDNTTIIAAVPAANVANNAEASPLVPATTSSFTATSATSDNPLPHLETENPYHYQHHQVPYHHYQFPPIPRHHQQQHQYYYQNHHYGMAPYYDPHSIPPMYHNYHQHPNTGYVAPHHPYFPVGGGGNLPPSPDPNTTVGPLVDDAHIETASAGVVGGVPDTATYYMHEGSGGYYYDTSLITTPTLAITNNATTSNNLAREDKAAATTHHEETTLPNTVIDNNTFATGKNGNETNQE